MHRARSVAATLKDPMFYPSVGSVELPVIIEHAVSALNDDLHLFRTMAKLVLDQIADEMPDLRAHAADQESAGLFASLHRLKGSLGAISAMPSYQACSALNSLARVDAAESFAMGLGQLEKEIGRLRPFLSAWLAKNEREEYEHGLFPSSVDAVKNH